MANFQTKKSVMAIKEETTEGTPVWPSSGSDGYLAIQEGFTLEANFETLDNVELTSSIGQAKTTLGFESPTASLSHYLRHSGTEGQEPNYAVLLEMAFGDKSVASTEYDTVAGSTTTVINVDTGEGVNFAVGDALLIKDATNGYSIRNIYSISSDALTLDFALDNAPASAVNLGKSVTYKPGESHPTATITSWRGDAGAIEQIAGARVVDMSTEFSAGEFINSSFSMEGIGFRYNPIEITSSNKYLDFDDAGGEENAVLTEKTYKDPIELAEEIQTKMDALTSDNITVTYSSSTGKYTIASDGATLSLLWNTGTNTANTVGGSIGFAVASDDTGATTYTSDSAIDLSSPYTPSFDSSNPLVAKNNEVLLGGQTDNVCFSTRSVTLNLGDAKTDVLDVCAESGKSGSVITEREVSVDIVANLPQYDADKFKRFRTNQTTRFAYHFGTKSSGNWEAGVSGSLMLKTATISSFNLSDTDGLVTLEMTVTGFVDSGLSEVFLNFL